MNMLSPTQKDLVQHIEVLAALLLTSPEINEIFGEGIDDRYRLETKTYCMGICSLYLSQLRSDDKKYHSDKPVLLRNALRQLGLPSDLFPECADF